MDQKITQITNVVRIHDCSSYNKTFGPMCPLGPF